MELVLGGFGWDQEGVVYAFSGPLDRGDLSAGAASDSWQGEGTGHQLGEALTTGDLDGDGVDEIVASSSYWPGDLQRRGRVYLLRPAIAAADSTFVVDGDVGPQTFGTASATGDFDGDGQDDLAVGNPAHLDEAERGRVLVFFGPLEGHHQAAEADLSLAGEAAGDDAGFALASGDVTGDGFADLVVGAPRNDEGAEDGGKIYLLPGPL
ncbi:MAG: integrin alpha [Myxococcota bacterium]